MIEKMMTRATALLLAIPLALLLAACEEDKSKERSALSVQTAGVDATESLGSALDNALAGTEDANDGHLSSAKTLSAGKINRAFGNMRGFRQFAGGAGGTRSLSEGPTTVNVAFSGSYPCGAGGTIGVVGDASFTYSWNDGTGVALGLWHQQWAITGLTMTLTECSQDGYTLNGTANYTTTQTANFDQSAEDSVIYDFLLGFAENSSATIVATQEVTGLDFDLALAWDLDATLTGTLDVLTEAAVIATVNATGVWTINEYSCTGTWTDPAADWQFTCTF